MILSIVSCKKYTPPDIENCVILEDGLYCRDKRVNDNEPYYLSYEEVTKYICTNHNDYGAIKAYVNDLREKLIKCKRRR